MIFVDSSVFIAALADRDSNHERAVALMADIQRGAWGTALLPDYVLVEVANWLLRKRGFGAAGAFLRATMGGVGTRVVPCSDSLRRAVPMFLGQRSHRLSLVDCSILALAEALGVPQVATFDAAFREIPGLIVVNAPRAS